MNGTIVKGIGGFYYVKTADKTEYECKARGIFRKERITPMIGDRVEIELNESVSEEGYPKASITKIYPRVSSLVRPPVANIDSMILVVAASSPEPNLFLIDKMLVNAEIGGIRPVICINKSDLATRADIAQIYTKAGYEVIETSAEENFGMEKIQAVLKDKVTAFAGLSGVGKSSILNIVTDEKIETGAVSEKISRGKHTTRHVELFELKYGGFVLDTPGFSSLEIEEIKADELWRYFSEMEDCEGQCRFRGCSHINEPDCAVKAKLERGEMSESRYASYKEIYEKLKAIKDWQRK